MDAATLTARYEARVRALLAGELPDAVALRGRLALEQWALEWQLPLWLGEAFGVDRATAEELALANVLGLVALRLRDDAADGELAIPVEEAADISARLFEAAVQPYRERLPPTSPFWPHLARRMTDWQAQPVELAGRGSPLQASAYAMCLLGGRPDAYAELERCLDHALTALVLYDHAADWPADLERGRSNAFVAHVASSAAISDRPTPPEVRLALMTADVVGGYFGRIGSELEQAAALADGLQVGGLAQHLRTLSARMRVDGLAMEAHYGAAADRAAALFE